MPNSKARALSQANTQLKIERYTLSNIRKSLAKIKRDAVRYGAAFEVPVNEVKALVESLVEGKVI